jgi:hypothetical protein
MVITDMQRRRGQAGRVRKLVPDVTAADGFEIKALIPQDPRLACASTAIMRPAGPGDRCAGSEAGASSTLSRRLAPASTLPRNEAATKATGVKRICIPDHASKSAVPGHEQKKRWFRDGRISVAKGARDGVARVADKCGSNARGDGEDGSSAA